MTSRLKNDLEAQGYQLRETHISWVFLTADRVYKIKKPVDLGFLDFTTLSARKRACDAELELNRRLAPDVYLRLLPVVQDAQGTHHLALAAESGHAPHEVVDWAVEMVRLNDDDSAEAMVERGELGRDPLRRLAALLAQFHGRCRSDEETSRFGTRQVIERNVRENFEQTARSVLNHLNLEQAEEIKAFQLQTLEHKQADFDRRITEQRIRDGHGDLRLEHVYFSGDQVHIIDCIEFNDRFRYGDTCADIAFLCMDLSFHQRPDLAEQLLAYYAEESQDYGLYRVVDFYMSYRAYVRAKVTAMLEQDTEQSATVQQRLYAQARRYFLLAEAAGRPALEPPFLLVVFGHIAAGKSTLARRLGDRLVAPVINSDRVRKHAAGVSPHTRLPPQAYAPKESTRVYARLREQGAAVLTSERPVIIDATCSGREQRARFAELARDHGVPILFVECSVPVALCRERLQDRERTPSISDGRLGLLDGFLARYEAPSELPAQQLLRVDTSVIDDALVERIAGHPALDTKP